VHVIATAGHVDHGKSTLVRALTGSDPDRLEEEHRRGLSIELGYAWTVLERSGEVAFVDVPGHERFVSTMLAGVGPLPAVLFVVAADDPWMPQAAEHLAALDAFGVTRGVLAVTRSDLVDPGPALARARAHIDRSGLAGMPAVTVSGRTGQGLGELRAALDDLASSLPAADPEADVRIWVDRVFTVRGAGTVVTGTLPAGTVRAGDTLVTGDTPLRIRGLETLGRPVDTVRGVARVALNLAGRLPSDLGRGSVLVSTGRWHRTCTVDVRLRGDATPPERPVLHVGATALAVHVRPLADDLVRLTLDHPLPLRVGDRALLRDPGSRALWGVRVIDPDPVPLRRRGAAAARAKELDAMEGSAAMHVVARGLVRRSHLARLGVDVGSLTAGVVAVDDWLVSPERAALLRERLAEAVSRRRNALDPGVPMATVAQDLGLPTRALVTALVRPPVRAEGGRLFLADDGGLPAALLSALEAVRADLRADPFAAPTADRLRDLGLDHRALAALERAGALVRLTDQVVLLPDALGSAVDRLRTLDQPFTTSDARRALGSSRRVVIPLLERLDARGLTVRDADDRRTVRPPVE
jgi:selenocysteine-specific elongation factor